MLNVTNTAPNLTSVALTSLPAQVGAALNITYACTDANNDVCNADPRAALLMQLVDASRNETEWRLIKALRKAGFRVAE